MTSRAQTLHNLPILTALVVCIAIFFIPQSASAHANLLEASPKPSEVLSEPPERVIIWFTEPIEPAFSNISVFNAGGADVTDGDTEFDPTEPIVMWVPLATIENGTYTVVWRNVSSVDGHKATGSFLFAVGEPLGEATQVQAAEQPLVQSPFDPLIRWVIYISIAVFAGGLFFELIIGTRLARTEDDTNALSFAIKVSNRFTTIALTAIVVVILAQIAQLILQTTIAFDISTFAIRPDNLIEVIAESDWGRFWSWRLTAAILAAIATLAVIQTNRCTNRTPESDEIDASSLFTETPFGIVAIALGGIYLLLISLTSHNAATPSDIRWFAIATDLIHIITATIWVGGISYLLAATVHALRSRDEHSRAALLQLATRFAPIAIFATTVLVASGIVSSLMQVSIPEALNTPYGRVLGIKVMLLIVLIALAIRNNRAVAKTTNTGDPSTRSLGRFIAIELGVAFAVLLATAGLASLEPARQYAERKGIGTADYITHTDTISGATFDIKLDPGNTGDNSLTVGITDNDGTPFPHADEVRARVKYLDDDFGEYFVPLDNQSPGQWSLEDVTIGVAGAYQLDVTVVRSDSFDSHISTRFSASSSTIASDLIRPSVQTAMSAFGILMLVAGVTYFVVTVFVAKPAGTTFNPHYGIAMVLAIIGIGVVINTFTVGIGIPDESKGNPFPLTQESIQIGLENYTTSCATCHGDTGRGDGPVGLALNPPPADLAIHVPLHTDNELYRFIADGIEGTPMVAQLRNLTSDEIWHLVNYIRTIAQQ